MHLNDQFIHNFTEMCIDLFSFSSSPDDKMKYVPKYILLIHAEGQVLFVFTHSLREEDAVYSPQCQTW